MILRLFLLSFFLLTAACSYRIGDFTVASTKNVDLSHGMDFKRLTTRVKGEDSVPIILGIPVGMPNMKTAIDHAIELNPGTVALTDAVVTQNVFSLVLFGNMGFVVEGTPLVDPSLQRSYGR